MDKTIIAYSSRHGICEKTAGRLAKIIGCPYQSVSNLRFLKNYDTIILGTSIYMSKGSKEMNSFIKAHKDELLKKNVGLFIVCANKEELTKINQLMGAFPNYLLEHAFYKGCLCRGVNVARLGILEKHIFVKASGIYRSFYEPALDEQEKLLESYKRLEKQI